MKFFNGLIYIFFEKFNEFFLVQIITMRIADLNENSNENCSQIPLNSITYKIMLINTLPVKVQKIY